MLDPINRTNLLYKAIQLMFSKTDLLDYTRTKADIGANQQFVMLILTLLSKQ